MSAQTAAILREAAEEAKVNYALFQPRLAKELAAAADVVQTMKVTDSPAVTAWVESLFDLKVVKNVMESGVRS